MIALRTVCFVAGVALALVAFSGTTQAVTTVGARVPELNPGSAASALTLLCSGLALIMARRAK